MINRRQSLAAIGSVGALACMGPPPTHHVRRVAIQVPKAAPPQFRSALTAYAVAYNENEEGVWRIAVDVVNELRDEVEAVELEIERLLQVPGETKWAWYKQLRNSLGWASPDKRQHSPSIRIGPIPTRKRWAHGKWMVMLYDVKVADPTKHVRFQLRRIVTGGTDFEF
jgi:hypothetical protein